MDLLKVKTMYGVLLLLLLHLVAYASGVVPAVQVVPQGGIESVNGSDINMGCASPLVDRGGVLVCNNSESYLVDGCSPAINKNTSNWASQLVTLRGNDDDVTVKKVLLTFVFDAAVFPKHIELDIFLCPEWNIGTPAIALYVDENSTLVYSDGSTYISTISPQSSPPSSSCDSLTPFTYTRGDGHESSSYPTWHIIVEAYSDVEWIYVGEIRFLDGDSAPTPNSCDTEMTTTTTTTTTSVMPTATPTASTSTSMSGSTSDSLSTSLTTSVTTSSGPPTSPTLPPSSDPSTDDNNTAVIVAGVAACIVIACIVIFCLVIGICLFTKKYRRSKTELKKLQNAVCEQQGVELKDTENDEGKADNPLYQTSPTDNGHQPNTTTTDCPLYQTAEVANSAYYSIATDPSPTEDDPFYSIVDEDKKATLRALKNNGNDQNTSTLPSAPQLLSQSPAPQGAPPIYSSVQKELPPELSPQIPDIYTECDETDESTAIYSDIHEKAPLVPTKSEALEEYLATKDAGSRHNSVNEPPASKPSKIASLPQPLVSTMKDNPTYESAEGNSDNADYLYAQPDIPRFHPAPTADGDEAIYSEAITPALFTRGNGGQGSGEKEGEAGDPQIYSSIYTIPATLPENLQRPLEVSSDNIIERKVLGIGQFGQVVLAYTNGLSMKDMGFSETESSWDVSIQVAVKKLRPDHSKSQQEAFDKEIKFMSRLKHPNVVRFIGVCHRDPAFIMMEYMEEGDLSQFLQRYSEIVESPSNDKQISTSTVVHMACQIASAMKYLASLNFVHRDLACRNCLVGKNFTVKLADFGMSRNLYESHYYRIQGNAVLPIRWMATECFYGIFSEKTDVWSFGITMWELFTLAKNKPYPKLTDQEVINDATVMGKHRQLLSKPAACPESVYDVMRQCWAANPKKRVMFSAIDEMLQECQ